MCGIYGKIRFDGRPARGADAGLACELLHHRGPDDRGVYANGPACLGHTRLSVIDLSPLGHQPMSNEDRSSWIVFNGEIYNFQELRPFLEVKGHRFRSRTDTEVVLHLYEELGPDAVERLRGMFALAVWNEKERNLFMARDRVGKKPLFYYLCKDFVSFSSELTNLASDPEIPAEVDREAIHHYLTFQSVPAPFSAYRGIRKLPPGHWMSIRDGTATIRRYWKLSFRPKLPADTPARRSVLEERLIDEIREAVRIRMVSDVPLGALLSGGVDSSGIVALMSRESGRTPVKTFSVGFREKEYNELQYAGRVASLFGTDHREFVLQPDMMSALPILVERFGEPFADPAALPMYYITKVAREHVTVALCGDGGDESFAGYDRQKLNVMWARFEWFPKWCSDAVLRLLPSGPSVMRSRNPVWIARRFFQTLSLPPPERNLRFFGHFSDAMKSDIYTPEFASDMLGIRSEDIVIRYFQESDADNILDAILYADIHTYLSDTLLPKVDITSMANSLEMRSPLLDHKLMEFAARLPTSFKIRGLEGKYILKKVFERFLPRDWLHRPKMGFGVPLDRWFREEKRDFVYDTLLSSKAIGRGYFRQEKVRKILDEHVRRDWLWQYHIFNLLMLELWHRRFIDP
jgi:asparagine synthase (glutamine-hydrolysing)